MSKKYRPPVTITYGDLQFEITKKDLGEEKEMDNDNWNPEPPIPDVWHVLSKKEYRDGDDPLPYETCVMFAVIDIAKTQCSVGYASFYHTPDFVGVDSKGWIVDPVSGINLAVDELHQLTKLLNVESKKLRELDQVCGDLTRHMYEACVKVDQLQQRIDRARSLCDEGDAIDLALMDDQ